MEYSITRTTLAPQPVLALRRTIKPDGIAQALGEMFPQVFGSAQKSGVAVTGAPYARYISMGRDEWVIEAGFPVSNHGPSSGEIVSETLPGGPAAMTVHAGPYDRLREAHAAIHEWLAAESVTAAGAPWESYVTDPGNHPDPKDWKTEVYVPLKA